MIRKIIWAFDAFYELDQLQKNAVLAIRSLVDLRGPNIKIEPVYVMPPDYVSTAEIFYPSSNGFQDQAFDSMKKKLQSVNLPGLCDPKVISTPSFTMSGAVKNLSQYAKEVDADLIVAGTHARTGVSRMFLGSFAEALILQSKTPVLIINPLARPVQKVRHILFPLDFGDESEVIFSEVLETAKSMNAKLILFHAIFKPTYIRPGIRLVSTQQSYLRHQRETSKKRASQYLAQAEKNGVNASFVSIASSSASSEVIVKYAKKIKAGLIVMAARSGRISSAIAGSVTRQVIRSSSSPVWVFRVKAQAERKNKKVA